jgi:hypothetical protein
MALAAVGSGIAALGLALIYAVGLVARAGELAAAGYSVQDVLPLVPLQQGLARGVAVLIDPLVVAGFILSTSAWLIQLFPDSKSHMAKSVQFHQELLAFLADAEAARSDLGPASTADDLSRRIARARRLLVRPSSPRDRAVARRELLIASHDVLDAASRAGIETPAIKALQLRVGTSQRPSPALAEARRWMFYALGTVGLAWWLLSAELSYLPVATLFAVAGLWMGWRLLRHDHVPEFSSQRFFMVVILLFVLGQAYLGARPLQRVVIETTDGDALKGALLASPGTQEGTWFVGLKSRDVRAVATADISSVRVFRPPNAQGRFDNRDLLDVIRD